MFTGYGPGASSQYGQVPQGPVPSYAGPGPGPGYPQSYPQQAVGPRMPSQPAGPSSSYSMYGSGGGGLQQPHAVPTAATDQHGRMQMQYPSAMQHTVPAAEQYPGIPMHQNAAAMSGWQGLLIFLNR